ncbi:MAG: hypothetical protein LKI80_06885 [Sporolactobacillus sp.]|nr:hypothetical protein [Sporolactobacillus sp.]
MALLVILVLILLLLNFLQSREIKRLKNLIKFDEDALKKEAELLLTTNDEVATIKKLRGNHYPLSLTKAKKIVDEAEFSENKG